MCKYILKQITNAYLLWQEENIFSYGGVRGNWFLRSCIFLKPKRPSRTKKLWKKRLRSKNWSKSYDLYRLLGIETPGFYNNLVHYKLKKNI